MRLSTLARLLVAVVAVLGIQKEGKGVDYYWNGTGAVTSTASWGTNTDGTGTNPTDFTTANQLFNLQTGQTATLGGAWTVSGTSSRLVIQTGGTFQTGTNNPTLTLDMQSGATYRTQNTTYGNLTFGTLDSNSTFAYAGGSGFAASRTYPNFVNESTTTLNTAASFTATGNVQQSSTNELRFSANTAGVVVNVGRDLIVDATRTLNFVSGTGSVTVNVARNLTNNGTLAKTGSGSATIAFTGSGNSGTATWGTFGTATTAATVTVATNRTVTFADSYVTSATRGITNNGTLNIGSGATLQGNGSISNTSSTVTVLSGGIIRGGTGTGTETLTLQNAGTININNGGTIFANIGASGTNSSINATTNVLNLVSGAKLSLTALAGFTNTGTRTYNIATLSDGTNLQLDAVGVANNFVFGTFVSTGGNAGTTTGSAVVIDLTSFDLTAGDTFTLSRSGNNLVLDFAPVPEPATVLAVGAAGLGAITWLRRKRKADAATATA